MSIICYGLFILSFLSYSSNELFLYLLLFCFLFKNIFFTLKNDYSFLSSKFWKPALWFLVFLVKNSKILAM
ncbi:hypothetical protein ACJBTO_10345, partial [Streptococcus suis]